MYEDYYGFVEKPFSLTPDPKFLYRSQSHASAFELLQYAIRRREGFVVVTGDIGTGKTTLCRAILEQLDGKTFTALVLNPFLSEEDLLKQILQDFGIVSREDVKRGRLAAVSKQELINALNDFLLSLLPIRARALLIIDEAQNLPRQVLEQIRILSNLETDKEKLLQIVLVGQLNLHALLRSADLRQLDQRVSIRYQLKPLTREEMAAYVSHRLMVAGGAGAVAFTAKAITAVHRCSGGIPRLINLLCDRALLGGYATRAPRITPAMVRRAAEGLDLRRSASRFFEWWRRRAAAAAAVAAATAVVAAAGASLAGQPPAAGGPLGRAVTAPFAAIGAAIRPASSPLAAAGAARHDPPAGEWPATPSDVVYSVLIASGELDADRDALRAHLDAWGFEVSERDVAAAPGGRQLLIGPYGTLEGARTAEELLRRMTGTRTLGVLAERRP